MFFQTAALPSGYSLGGGPFLALNLPYHQTAPALPPPPMGYTYQAPGKMAAAPSPTLAATPGYHVGGRPASHSYSKNSSTTSVPGGIPVQSHNGTGNRIKRDTKRQPGSSLTSMEPSPGMVTNCGWGVSVTSLSSSPASSMTTPPVYFMLQKNPPQYPHVSPSLGCVAGAPPPPPLPPSASRMALASPQGQVQKNGSMYELGEWYEGVVKRYNPMRGFGFLTATHHLTVLSSPPPVSQQPSLSSSALDEKLGGTVSTNPVEEAGGSDTASAVLQARMERTPVTLGDIFVHQSYIQMQGFRALAVGDKVVFRIGVLQGKHGHQAVSVQQIGGMESGNDATTVGTGDVSPRAENTPTEEEEQQEDEIRSCADHQHNNDKVQELLHRLAVKDTTADIALGATVNCSTGLSVDELSEECIESCCLPSPFFTRNTVALELAATVDVSEATSPVHVNHTMTLPDADEVYDFLAPFDEK